MKKKFISAQKLLELSSTLAVQIFESGYRPNFIVGIWRGGAPIGICVQEILEAFGVQTDHIAIRTSSYTAIGQQNKQIKVHGLRYIEKNINAEDKLLIIDDVYDSGRSIAQVLLELQAACRKNMPEVKIATPFFTNQTTTKPNAVLIFLFAKNQSMVGLSARAARPQRARNQTASSRAGCLHVMASSRTTNQHQGNRLNPPKKSRCNSCPNDLSKQIECIS